MRILKIKGKSEETILNEIEKEYGEAAVVLSTSKEEHTGLAKWFKPSRTVITIAVKDEVDEKDEQDKVIKHENITDKEMEQNLKESKEYNLLLQLQEQISMLQKGVLEINNEESQTSINTNEWYQYIYNKCIENGIEEAICKTLLEGTENYELEDIIENVYSRLEIVLNESNDDEMPRIVFFIGPTGVGKTTTLAKLTAKYVLEEQKKVVLFTADTYRIAAVEQLRTYADILGVEIEVIYDESELPKYIEKWKHMDHILIDTAGRSHKNVEQVNELKSLIENTQDKKVCLVLNVNTSYTDIKSIIKTYMEVSSEFDLILTKLDETDAIGNLVNISASSSHKIMYTTSGQNVPSDISLFKKDNYIAELLGRINNE